MYAVAQRINQVASAVNTLSVQVKAIDDKVKVIDGGNTDKGMNNYVVPADIDEKVSKVQKEMTVAINGLKNQIKEVDATLKDLLKKEVSKQSLLFDTTIGHKIDQSINKILKERLEVLSIEQRAYIDRCVEDKCNDIAMISSTALTSDISVSENKNDDLGIKITENETGKKGKATRKKGVSVDV
jgi:outer membrane murein-binding lipoprotein Lpp